MANKKKSPVKDGTVIGVGVLLVGGLAAIIIWFFWRQRRNQQLQLQAAQRQHQAQLSASRMADRSAAVPGDSVKVSNPRTGDEILISVR